jgi:hypothetical protein
MCSKKCANPDLPGSTSLREPVSTGICSDTMFGNPVGTTITFSPFGSVRSVTVKGSSASASAAVAAGWVTGADPMTTTIATAARMQRRKEGMAAVYVVRTGRDARG